MPPCPLSRSLWRTFVATCPPGTCHEPGARLGDDPEELHDLRVAGRRLDGILRQFRAYLPAPFLRLRPVIKEALRALGEARDLDVALSELETFGRELTQSDREGVEPLKRHLVSERRRARARMLSVLDSGPVQDRFQNLSSLLAASSAASQRSSSRVGAARGTRIDPRAVPEAVQKRGSLDAGFLDGGVSRGP